MKVALTSSGLILLVGVILILLAGGVAGIVLFSGSSGEADGAALVAEGTDLSDTNAAGAPVKLASRKSSEGGAGDDTGDEAASGGEEGEEGERNGKEKTPIPVSVERVSVGRVSSYITSTANLVAEDEVQILAEAEGRVARLLVEEGDRVRRGQILASLVKDDQEIALKKAKVRAKNARLAYERAVRVVDEELMSREEFDRIAMEHEIARQELAEAEWRLEKTNIRAPFDGRVTRREVMLGKNIRMGDALFTVADFDPLIARIYLPEKDVLGLREGRDVRITLKADEAVRFQGRIRQISPVVDTATGTVKITIEAESPPRDVRPGAFVSIDIVRQTRPEAVLLPRQAVLRELREAYVFVANGGVAERRSVALGLEEGAWVEAVSGVDPGEQVIVAGQGGLKDGSSIKVIPTSEASALTAPDAGPPRG
ncbi:MAG: efflux RND transporter periplasmic adaptor subunit [Acidobacteriota bacterium]